jgi:glycosyltransferase involved in cell wall biosynthesis
LGYRILTIAPTSFFSDYGCHVRILEEAWALEKLGNKVTIFTYHNGNDVPGIDIRRSLDVPWKKGVEVGSSRHKLYFDAMLGYKVLRSMRRIQPDIIHGHIHEGAFIGETAGVLSGVPVVFDFQGSLAAEMVDHNFLNPNGAVYRPVKWLERRINMSAHRIITSSHNAAEMLVREFHVPAGRVRTVPDCVSTDRFHPLRDEGSVARIAGLKNWLKIPAGRKVVVYLGILAKYQGTDILLEAARILLNRGLDVHFLIMGFPGVDRYRKMAADLGLAANVVFPGRIPYVDAPLYLALGNVAVSPKMSTTEASGKISNYMAMEMPVVAFDYEVAREIMGDAGIYAEMGNALSLADCLERALVDEEYAARTSKALRERAERELSWGQAAQQIMEVYAEAIESSKRRFPFLPIPTSLL